MVEQGRGGRIINISSTGAKGFRGTSSPAYAASKGAIISMTYIAAVQLASHDINVNAICPGPTDTVLLDEVRHGPKGDKIIAAMERAVAFSGS